MFQQLCLGPGRTAVYLPAMDSEPGAPWNYSDPQEWMERGKGRFGPLIVTCAVNGGIQGKESHPELPETPAEIAEQARRAVDAGASIIHIHGRNPNALATNARDSETYLEINARVREACPDVIINNSSGGGPLTTMEERFESLDGLPEMASLNLGPDMSRFRVPERPDDLPDPHPAQEFDCIIPFTYGIIDKLAGLMAERGIKPEMETYHSGQFGVSRDLIERGLIEPPYVHQFVMGYQTSVLPTPGHLLQMLGDLPKDSLFFVCGIGRFQLPMTTMSILLGGHVRVGLEDNLYYSRGRKLKDNGEAVERIVRISRELDREIASPSEARRILGLSEPRTY
jgi:3-keto-5-aminohexanoate cleavage enzyme